MQNSHSISLSGGNDRTKAFFSGGYFKEEGMMRNDNMTRYTARFNVEHKINNWAKAGLLGQLAQFDQNFRRGSLGQALSMTPFGIPFDEDGKINLHPIPGNQSTVSPLADERGPYVARDNRIRTNVMMNAFVEIKPIEGLTLRSNLGTNLTSHRRGRFESPESFGQRNNPRAETFLENEQRLFYNWDNILTYNKKFGDHSVTLTGITNYWQSTTDNSWMLGYNQALPQQLWYNMGATDANSRQAGSSFVRQNMMSYAGRIHYSYKGKYMLTATQRYDGASQLSPANRWDAFPSVAGSWIVSDEAFMNNISQISLFKIRASYGVAGNAGIGPYGTQTIVNARPNMSFGEEAAMAYVFGTRAANYHLGWEKTATANLAFDMGFFNDRFTATVDLYNSNTSGLLLLRNLPHSTGMLDIFQNVGETNNKGVEIVLTSKNIQKKDFSWTTTGTFTRNREKITALIDGEDIIRNEDNSLLLGRPINSFFSYKKLGIWQLDEADQAAELRFGSENGTQFRPGDIKIEDVNGDGIIDADDRQYLGSRVPDFIFGLQNNFRYKNFDLGFFVFARWGQMISADVLGRYNPSGEGNGPAFVNYWTPENPTNDYPRPNRGASLTNYAGYQSLTFVDGSFIKLQNIQVGYNLPKNLANKLKVEHLRVYATGNNLWTYAKHPLLREYDPERGGAENFPLNRQLVFGVNIDF